MVYQVLVRQLSGANWDPFEEPTSDPFAAMRLIQQANQQFGEVSILQADNLGTLQMLLDRLQRGELPPQAVSIGPALTSTPRVSIHEEIWEVRRWELEQGSGGDHDTPYHFELPLNVKVVTAWLSLLANRQRDEEVA